MGAGHNVLEYPHIPQGFLVNAYKIFKKMEYVHKFWKNKATKSIILQ